jgi:hypothetical protein
VDFTFEPVFRYWIANADQIHAAFETGNTPKPMLNIYFQSGLMHMELEGRPDGRSPHNKASYYHYLIWRWKKSRKDNSPFGLSPQDFVQLEQELVLYLIRSLAYMHLHKYALANLDLKFISRTLTFACKASEDAATSGYFRQYLDLVQVIEQKSLALIQMEKRNYSSATQFLSKGNLMIEKLYKVADDSCTPCSRKDLLSLKQFMLNIPILNPAKTTDIRSTPAMV